MALFAVAALAGPAVGQTGAPLPWMDATLAPDARANLVQAQMTPDEELILVKGYIGIYAKQSSAGCRPMRCAGCCRAPPAMCRAFHGSGFRR